MTTWTKAGFMDQALFEQYVREAMEHLFDPAYLHSHPLAALLAPRKVQGMAGEALQRALREAIEALKPSRDVPRRSPAWRTYLALRLRHVDVLTMPEVADQLGIGTRQCRRDHHKAVTMVASALWETYQAASGGTEEHGPASTQTATRSEKEPTDSPLDTELAKLGQHASDLTNVGQVVEGILATISPLVERKAIHLAAAVPPDLPLVAMSRTALRQALLGILLSAMDWGQGCQVALAALARQEFIDLECLVQ
ncbi:MAG: sigma-70 family RNA polymerase sigma factor, partial [Chloroflexi bacterium]|nr:sigma-70 family RNA polymerase sigma factor [Chloroflexota bacterium]